MKKFAALFALAMLLVFSCTAIAESVSIAIVYSDTVDDKGWCQSMDNGVKNAIAKGYDIEYTPVESVQVPDAPNTLDQLAENYDIIIVHGAQFSAATTEIAAEYPEQVFALGTSDKILGDNIFTYMPMSEEPGYINGIIAAMTTIDFQMPCKILFAHAMIATPMIAKTRANPACALSAKISPMIGFISVKAISKTIAATMRGVKIF